MRVGARGTGSAGQCPGGPDRRRLSARSRHRRLRRPPRRVRVPHGVDPAAGTRSDCDRLGGERRRARGAARAGAGGRAEVIKKAALVLIVLLAVGVAGLLGVSRAAPKPVPTTHVQRGRVQVTVYATGDLRASRSIQLAAPPMGGQLQIVQLKETGESVKAGEAVV